jgi:hypothetical protein
VISNLNEARNEWCARLISIFTPLVGEGVKSIFNEAWKLCLDNDEANKYLMTFQNLLSRVPKWNNTIVEEERKRIIERSGCNYLEDLITCVHIIQLKVLTCIRVGNKQKKIDISVPKLDSFIHKVYINVARKVYMNVYLFEINITPLQVQKNNRELETIIQECILNTLRESIPVESILKAYMDETIEEDVTEEIKEQEIKEQEYVSQEPNKSQELNKTHNFINENSFLSPSTQTQLKFDDTDYMKDSNNNITSISAPKTIERLEEISNMRSLQNQLDNEDDNNNIKLKITDCDFQLDDLDIQVIDEPKLNLFPDLLIDDIEVLE